MNDITHYLMRRGCNPAYQGFNILESAIELFDPLQSLNQDLYPRLAVMYNRKPSTIRNNIRYCLKNSGIRPAPKKFIITAKLQCYGSTC